MGTHPSGEVHVDHQALRRDLRTIALLSAALFGAIVGLWLLESKIGILAALAGRGA